MLNLGPRACCRKSHECAQIVCMQSCAPYVPGTPCKQSSTAEANILMTITACSMHLNAGRVHLEGFAAMLLSVIMWSKQAVIAADGVGKVSRVGRLCHRGTERMCE